MLSSTDANLLMNKINTAFAGIGSNGTGMPKSKRNTESVAWEFLVAKHLKRMADGRDKAATKAAVKAGIIFDPEKEPRTEGTRESVYNGDVVQIGVETKMASVRLDTSELQKQLYAAGVAKHVIEECMAAAMKPNRPPHTFTTALVTDGGSSG